MKVISVSRRTDVAAFYPAWFMNRIREGCARWVNPFSNVVHETSLRPEDVLALVFVSKNYLPLVPHLDELDNRGYRMLFHFTINGLPKVFEPGVPDAEESVRCARVLSRRYSADAVLWRYDPIVLSTVTDAQYHLRRFGELCEKMDGAVRRCYFSFPAFYRKVQRNLASLRAATGIECFDAAMDDRIELAHALADVASAFEIEMVSCCGDYLVGGKIARASCIDAKLLCRLFPDRARHLRPAPTRDGCGCCECTDIGAYDTCPHGCVYCYANSNPRAALANYTRHKSNVSMLKEAAGAACGPIDAPGSACSGGQLELPHTAQ